MENCSWLLMLEQLNPSLSKLWGQGLNPAPGQQLESEVGTGFKVSSVESVLRSNIGYKGRGLRGTNY